ncbi:hypothetical protein Tco_0687799 [Tanacetum coccineum]
MDPWYYFSMCFLWVDLLKARPVRITIRVEDSSDPGFGLEDQIQIIIYDVATSKDRYDNLPSTLGVGEGGCGTSPELIILGVKR